MKKLTIIAGKNGTGFIHIEGNGKVYDIPVGVEIAVDDELFQAAINQYECRAGYFVNDALDVASLPTSGIADGSYCFIMSTQAVKFLSEGAWVQNTANNGGDD